MATTVYGQAHSDSQVIIHDDADSTKELALELSGITTATKRIWTVPDQNLDLTPGVDFAAVGGAGEANTMSSAGTGVEIFNAKNVFDFPMRDLVGLTTGGIDVVLNGSDVEFDLDIANMTADTTPTGTDEVAIQATGGGALNKVTLTNLSKGIDHDQLANFVSGEHFLQSGITTTGTVATGDWTSPDIIASRSLVTAIATDMILLWDDTDSTLKRADASDFLAGAGDMVLADVQTVTGAKTFEDTTLLMRNTADSFSITFTNAVTAARTITWPDEAGTVAIAGGAYHDGFSDFAADEHVAHASVSIATASATSGLSGGGTIASTRNLIVDIAGTTDEASPATGDELILNNVSGPNLRRADVLSVVNLADHDALTNFDTNEHFLQSAITEVGTLSVGDVTTQVSASSESLAGRIELATVAETETGTDDARAVTPLKLANSLQKYRAINAQTGTSYTAVADDAGKLVTMDNGSANTISINDSVFEDGDIITIVQKGAGVTTIAGSASNSTTNSLPLTIIDQFGIVTVVIYQEGATTLSIVSGDLG